MGNASQVAPKTTHPIYKTPAAPPYLTLLQATTREVTSGTKAVRIVTRLTGLYTEKTS